MPSTTALHCHRLSFGFYIRCCNELRRIGKHQNIQEECKHPLLTPSSRRGPGPGPGPDSQIRAVGLSFKTYPKALLGSQIQCCNKRLEELGSTPKHQRKSLLLCAKYNVLQSVLCARFCATKPHHQA